MRSSNSSYDCARFSTRFSDSKNMWKLFCVLEQRSLLDFWLQIVHVVRLDRRFQWDWTHRCDIWICPRGKTCTHTRAHAIHAALIHFLTHTFAHAPLMAFCVTTTRSRIAANSENKNVNKCVALSFFASAWREAQPQRMNNCDSELAVHSTFPRYVIGATVCAQSSTIIGFGDAKRCWKWWLQIITSSIHKNTFACWRWKLLCLARRHIIRFAIRDGCKQAALLQLHRTHSLLFEILNIFPLRAHAPQPHTHTRVSEQRVVINTLLHHRASLFHFALHLNTIFNCIVEQTGESYRSTRLYAFAWATLASCDFIFHKLCAGTADLICL